MSDTKKKLDEAATVLKDNLDTIKKKEREDTEKLLKKLKKATSDLKTETKNSADLMNKQKNEAERRKQEEEEKRKREEEEKRRNEEKAKGILDAVIQMCDDPKSTKESIGTKLKEFEELDIENKTYQKDSEEAFKTFKSNVESQEKAIGELKEELDNITTEDALEEFEKKVKSEVEDKLYADNKQQFDTLEQKMEKKVDTLEDESIIGGVIALLPKEDYDKRDQDIANIRKIVEAEIPQMLEEVTKEINDIKKYFETHDDKFLGVEKYDLTPQGVEAVSKYINQNPDPKENKKDDTKVTKEKNKEHNIDILNLILGGIMTQDFRDIMKKSGEKVKHLINYLDIANEFIKKIKFTEDEVKQLDKILTALENSIKNDKKEKTMDEFKKVLKKLHMSLKFAMKSTEIAMEILEEFNKHEEKYKEFKKSLENKSKKERTKIINKKLLPADDSFAFVSNVESFGLTPSKGEVIISDEDKEKLINSLIMLDHYFDDEGNPKENPVSSKIIPIVQEHSEEYQKKRENEQNEEIKQKKNLEQKTSDQTDETKEEEGVGILNASSEQNQIVENNNYPYLKILKEILEYYFVYENEKWKFKDDKVEQKYKAIIEYFKNPKYIITVGDEKSECDKKSKIVKCYGVLEKLSKKYPRKYKKIIGDFKNEVNEVNDKDLLNNQLLVYKDDNWVINPDLENEINKQIIIQDPLSKIEKEMKKVEDQLDLKMEFLNTIMKKYALLAKKKVKSQLEPKDDDKIQDIIKEIIQEIESTNNVSTVTSNSNDIKHIIKDIIKDGYELAKTENKDITVPFSKAIHVRMEDYTNITKSHNEKLEQDILKKRVKHVVEALPPHVILAKNLKKLNIKKKKDYSSFKEIPTDYDPIVVKNEVSQKLYEKLKKIKDSKSSGGFGKSRRKNKFGLSPQSGEENIGKLSEEASGELVDIINNKLGENLAGKLFKPKIEEDEVKNFIKAIPNKLLQVKMTKKLESKLKNTQPASLEDLNRKINKDTKELTKNTNKIYDKVKNLVDRINKKDNYTIKKRNRKGEKYRYN